MGFGEADQRCGTDRAEGGNDRAKWSEKTDNEKGQRDDEAEHRDEGRTADACVVSRTADQNAHKTEEVEHLNSVGRSLPKDKT